MGRFRARALQCEGIHLPQLRSGIPGGFFQRIMATELKPLLVVDKSFANRKTGTLSKFSSDYTLVVPSAFFYEVFTTAPEKRLRELTNFPEFRQVHVPALQHIELETGMPAMSFQTPELSFNSEVANASWKLNSAQEATLLKYREDSIIPALDFWRNVLTSKVTLGFSKEELTATKGSEEEFVGLCNELKDERRIQKIGEEIGWRHAAKLDSRWIHFRHFQTWALQGLILLRRYPHPRDAIGDTRLEHDVLDNDYLMLGLHVGALATAETSPELRKASMGWRYRLLEPNGDLITE